MDFGYNLIRRFVSWCIFRVVFRDQKFEISKKTLNRPRILDAYGLL